jgi:anti-anti-sigma factor
MTFLTVVALIAITLLSWFQSIARARIAPEPNGPGPKDLRQGTGRTKVQARTIWAAMPEDAFPVEWAGRQAVVTLPEHIDVSNVAQLREQLLSVINRGAAVLIADMTSTASCDHAAVDAIARAYQWAAVSGTQLRLVVTAPVVRRVLSIEGLERLVSIYPSVAAAVAAGTPGAQSPAAIWVRGRADDRPPAEPGAMPGAGAITPAVLWQLIDALGDGLALTSQDGEIVLVNRRCAEMFGYDRKELVGRPIESLVPSNLRAAHEAYRADYARAPQARPMAERARLVALRRDGGTFPVEISLSPVPTATGHFVLAVIRDAAQDRRREDLADLARAAVAEHTRRDQELLDRVVHGLFEVGLSMQAAVDLPSEVARERITQALRQLDDTIHEIRDYAFSASARQPPADPASSNGAA